MSGKRTRHVTVHITSDKYTRLDYITAPFDVTIQDLFNVAISTSIFIHCSSITGSTTTMDEEYDVSMIPSMDSRITMSQLSGWGGGA
jgi:hypothetical protein